MSTRIPTITAHKQLELAARGFDIQHKVFPHKNGKGVDAFTVEFQKATRRFRFFFGFDETGSIYHASGVPIFVVSKKDPTKERLSEDSTAKRTMRDFYGEIGIEYVGPGPGSFLLRVKQKVAA